MGHLLMSFRGICMHMYRQNVPRLPDDVVHRVVAVDAEQGANSAKFGQLPPHVCSLETTEDVAAALSAAGLVAGPDGRFPLQGVSLRVVNPARSASVAKPFLTKVPSLTAFAPGMVPRPDLMIDPVPRNVDCFVDITHGIVEERQFDEGGIYATWRIETNGDPVLLLTGARGRAVAVQIPSTADERLVDGVHSSIVLHNDSSDGLKDSPNDFALHYLAAVGGIDGQTYVADLPGQSGGTANAYPIVSTTTSCSNSVYP